MLALAVFSSLAAAAAYWFLDRGYTLYYGDAESHLNIARKVVDGRTSGYDQLGTVWLPLLHVLLLPLVADDAWWRSALAGAIPGAACFALAATAMFLSVRRLSGSSVAGWSSALVLALNPNLLYLQSTPMTEPVFFAMLLWLFYATLRIADGGGLGWVIVAAVFANLACLTRYEAWLLLPVLALFILLRSEGPRWRNALVFGLLASMAPLYWMAHNWWYYGNALEFYNGPYSARAIYQRALDAGMARYPGDHDWLTAARYLAEAARLALGWPLVVLGAIGVVVALFKRLWWPVIFLMLPPVFYVASMYQGNVPIFVPHLWPHSYYNTRYGLALLPAAAFGVTALLAVIPTRLQVPGAAFVVLASISPWAAQPRPDAWICWRESQVNSEARRQWTNAAAEFMRENYRLGAGILMPFGDLSGILRVAGIPIRETLHDGNNPHWQAVLARPDLFLWEEWAIAIAADPVSTLLQRSQKNGPFYRCVKMVSFKGAPVIEIYRRERRVISQHNDDSIHESSRGEE